MTTTTKHSVSEERVVLPVDLRDYFAAKAMQGLILNEADDGTIGSDNVEPALAKLSYKIADAMLTERAKDQP